MDYNVTKVSRRCNAQQCELSQYYVFNQMSFKLNQSAVLGF